MFFPPFKSLVKKLRQQKSRSACRSVHLHLEELEPLIAPADLTWTAMGGNPNWSTPNNWSTHNAPQNGDALFFGLPTVNSTDDMAGLTLSKLTVTINYTGIITLNQSLNVTDQVNLAAGTITGSANLQLAGGLGQFNWSGGTMSGSAFTFIGSSTNVATLNISGNVTLQTRDLLVESGSTGNWTAGNITMNNSAAIVNQGTFSVTTAGTIATADNSSNVFNNDRGTGSFTVNITGGGQVTSNVDFLNYGTVTLTSGNLELEAVPKGPLAT